MQSTPFHVHFEGELSNSHYSVQSESHPKYGRISAIICEGPYWDEAMDGSSEGKFAFTFRGSIELFEFLKAMHLAYLRFQGVDDV